MDPNIDPLAAFPAQPGEESTRDLLQRHKAYPMSTWTWRERERIDGAWRALGGPAGILQALSWTPPPAPPPEPTEAERAVAATIAHGVVTRGVYAPGPLDLEAGLVDAPKGTRADFVGREAARLAKEAEPPLDAMRLTPRERAALRRGY